MAAERLAPRRALYWIPPRRPRVSSERAACRKPPCWRSSARWRHSHAGHSSITQQPPLSPAPADDEAGDHRSEEHTSELQSLTNLVCRLLLEKNKRTHPT